MSRDVAGQRTSAVGSLRAELLHRPHKSTGPVLHRLRPGRRLLDFVDPAHRWHFRIHAIEFTPQRYSRGARWPVSLTMATPLPSGPNAVATVLPAQFLALTQEIEDEFLLDCVSDWFALRQAVYGRPSRLPFDAA